MTLTRYVPAVALTCAVCAVLTIAGEATPNRELLPGTLIAAPMAAIEWSDQSPTCGKAPVPDKAACGQPTAQCRDASWSCSQHRSGTCSHHKGVSCWVCPGRLC